LAIQSGWQKIRSPLVQAPDVKCLAAKVNVRSLFVYWARAATLPFMDEKLMVATEGLLKASLERLFRTLRNKRASKETRVRGILEFHFTSEAAVRSFLEDIGMVEE
jgi:hypothetical protein